MEKGSKEFRYDLGILFVHGIGQQVQGDTLVRFGEPIQQWLQRWLSQKSEPADLTNAAIVEAAFNRADNPERGPAHATLQIEGESSGQDFSSRWLFSESWWANTFLSPRFSDIATWGFQILPWSMSTHFATRARRVWKRFGVVKSFRRLGVGLRLMLEIFSFFLALMLFPVFVSLLMLILIIGALPIPRVRAFAAQLQQLLARTLGDSYVLIASPIQEAVIVGKVEEDLRWLLGQGCRRIAVVAHSQGSAVAHAALKNVLAKYEDDMAFVVTDETNVLFVSVGSGLNKLSEIRDIRGKSDPKSLWYAPMGFLLSALSLPEAIASIQYDEINVIAGIFSTFGIGFLVRGISLAFEQFRPSPDALKFNSKWRVNWLDFHASADPVPNGPMYDSDELTREVMDSRKVYNKSSVLFDHTTYWKNEDQFVAQLTGALCDLAEVPFYRQDSMDELYLAVAGARRKWRIGWLFLMRLVIIVLTIVMIGMSWEDLTLLTDKSIGVLTSIVDNIPLIGGLISIVNLGEDASQLVSVSIIILIGILVYLVIYGTWSVWSKTDLVSLFERKPYQPLDTTFIVFLFASVLSIEGYVLAISGMGAGILPGLIATAGAWIMLYLAILLVMGFLFAVVWYTWKSILTSWRIARKLIKWGSAGASSSDVAGSPKSHVDRPKDRDSRRIWVSFFALIILTFPFIAIVASGMTADQLWAGRNTWDYIFENPEELLSAIEQQSNNYPIKLWQWTSGAFVLVFLWNAIGIMGGFKKVYQWFTRISWAEPVAVARERLESAKEVLV